MTPMIVTLTNVSIQAQAAVNDGPVGLSEEKLKLLLIAIVVASVFIAIAIVAMAIFLYRKIGYLIDDEKSRTTVMQETIENLKYDIDHIIDSIGGLDIVRQISEHTDGGDKE